MITFKDFLLEKKMGGSAYAQTFKRLEDEARIGFEIEVFVPTGSFYHRDPDLDPAKKLLLTDINTWPEIQTYFNLSRQQEGSIMGEFEHWKTEKEDDWVDQNWQDFVTDDESRTAERDARRAALKQVTNKYNWQMWFTQEFADIHEFLMKYELEPTHGWADDHHVNQHAPQSSGYYSGFKNTAKAMAEHLGRALKRTVRVNAQGYETWNLTHDTSIKDSEGLDDESGQDGVGVEIVSPPMAPSKALAELELVLKTLDQFGIETNESTGIHVNISLPDMKNFDPLKLVLFMGDKYILKKFDRLANTFTNSQLQQVIDSVSMTGKIPRSAKELIEIGRQVLAETGKHFSVNLNHLPKYLEFRAAGGQDYHRRLYDIKEAIGRWLSAVEIAADPELHRREYLKKVMRLAQGDASEPKPEGMSFEELVLKADGKFALDNLEDVLENKTDPVLRARALLLVFLQLGSEDDSTDPTLQQKKDARAMLRRAGVSGHEVLDQAKDRTNATAVAAALKRFRLLGK
jgi:Putative amidoligase enzyme